MSRDSGVGLYASFMEWLRTEIIPGLIEEMEDIDPEHSTRFTHAKNFWKQLEKEEVDNYLSEQINFNTFWPNEPNTTTKLETTKTTNFHQENTNTNTNTTKLKTTSTNQENANTNTNTTELKTTSANQENANTNANTTKLKITSTNQENTNTNANTNTNENPTRELTEEEILAQVRNMEDKANAEIEAITNHFALSRISSRFVDIPQFSDLSSDNPHQVSEPNPHSNNNNNNTAHSNNYTNKNNNNNNTTLNNNNISNDSTTTTTTACNNNEGHEPGAEEAFLREREANEAKASQEIDAITLNFINSSQKELQLLHRPQPQEMKRGDVVLQSEERTGEENEFIVPPRTIEHQMFSHEQFALLSTLEDLKLQIIDKERLQNSLQKLAVSLVQESTGSVRAKRQTMKEASQLQTEITNLHSKKEAILAKLKLFGDSHLIQELGKIKLEQRGRLRRKIGQVIHDFNAEFKGEMDLRVGETIVLLYCSPEEKWWIGKLGEKMGLFPACFVKPIVGHELYILPPKPRFAAPHLSPQTLPASPHPSSEPLDSNSNNSNNSNPNNSNNSNSNSNSNITAPSSSDVQQLRIEEKMVFFENEYSKILVQRKNTKRICLNLVRKIGELLAGKTEQDKKALQEGFRTQKLIKQLDAEFEELCKEIIKTDEVQFFLEAKQRPFLDDLRVSYPTSLASFNDLLFRLRVRKLSTIRKDVVCQNEFSVADLCDLSEIDRLFLIKKKISDLSKNIHSDDDFYFQLEDVVVALYHWRIDKDTVNSSNYTPNPNHHNTTNNSYTDHQTDFNNKHEQAHNTNSARACVGKNGNHNEEEQMQKYENKILKIQNELGGSQELSQLSEIQLQIDKMYTSAYEASTPT